MDMVQRPFCSRPDPAGHFWSVHDQRKERHYWPGGMADGSRHHYTPYFPSYLPLVGLGSW